MVSVLMGVYYQKDDIAMLIRSVGSILDQTIKNLELVICDDGSAPQVCSYLTQAASLDHRICLVRPGRCYSLPEKLNVCLGAARGEWIARMDDDDYAHPDRIKCQLDYLVSHPEIAFVGCCSNLYRGGNLVGVRSFPEYPQIQDFYFTQPYLHPTLIFRREALEQVKGYSETMWCRLCEDYDLLLRLYHAGYQGANLPDVLFDYTLPLTAKGNRKMRHRWNEVLTRYRRFRELGLLPKAFPWVVKPIAVGLLPEGILSRLKRQKEGQWRA